MDYQRKTYIVDSFDELPEDLRRKVIKSEIAETDADKFFAYVINILHFKTKHNFYTTEQYKNRHKPQQRRYNNGPSKVSDSIVSVNALEAEAEELLAKDFKKRNYKFVIQIGKGGFGRVFMVKSVKDKGKIAVKRIPHVTSKQQRKNFQEMRFLQYAKHPNIIKYLRSYLVGDEIWLMTEYMQGGTLTQAVAVHKFEEDQIAYICQQILFALDFLHDNQLMHRDLKSANIMLDFNDGSVKLIDFGLCSDVSQGEVVHMVGSPFWMPPEMIRRDPHGLPVDIWSLGVCLMELANGHPPNRKSSIKAMFVAVTDGYTEPFEDPKRFSNEFKDFMSHCLQIVPAQRWTVKQLLAHPWLKRAASKEDMERLFRNIFVANKLKFNGL
eukprot:TRINITY_DN4862_c0_g1_i5.p1 TRINITY_DN4862_c0_g1~~TRINITY_DN4862_c0_g1_i5.p1  ORF type:complete len:382 (-),score=10.79 TRINITY_DN4862_c0_g1_i5:50-1195(-)